MLLASSQLPISVCGEPFSILLYDWRVNIDPIEITSDFNQVLVSNVASVDEYRKRVNIILNSVDELIEQYTNAGYQTTFSSGSDSKLIHFRIKAEAKISSREQISPLIQVLSKLNKTRDYCED